MSFSTTRPEGFEASDDHLFTMERKMADGVFVKQMGIPKAGMYVSQHTHTYDHTSWVATGAVVVWEGDATEGVIHRAPTGIMIRAHQKHMFMSLEDNTIVYCIHNVSRTGEVEIDNENPLV